MSSAIDAGQPAAVPVVLRSRPFTAWDSAAGPGGGATSGNILGPSWTWAGERYLTGLSLSLSQSLSSLTRNQLSAGLLTTRVCFALYSFALSFSLIVNKT